MRRLCFAAAAAIIAAPVVPGSAATQAGPAVQQSQVEPAAVVAEVRRIIAERYVLPERRPALDKVLADGLASGRYAVRDPAVLAERINADLERVGRDEHLNFAYNPQQAAILSSLEQETPDRTAFDRQVRQNNHGVKALRVLPGNIRYLDYEGFMWLEGESAAALETAARFLKGGDAIIIDLRRNGGGSPRAVQYLVSHFIEAGRPLVTFHMNGEPEPNSLSSLEDVPAGRMVDKPLYVLISPGTASAAEEFTGHILGYKLGEVVGETTAGAGFRNDVVPIDGGFLLSVSVGRAVLASTGRDWEAVGHAPTIRSDVSRALEVAQVHALRRLASSASAEERARLQGLAEGIAAQTEPRAAGLPLTAYAGSFGERAVRLEEGKLYYQFGQRPRRQLIPLGGHLFTFEEDPELRVRFAASGNRIEALEIGTAGGPTQGLYPRTQ